MRSHRVGPLLFAVSLAFSALSVPGVAHAEPTAADKETARRLMQEGRAHRRSGDAKGALESFQAADAIMQVPTTGLEVAKSQVDAGLLVEARDRLLQVVRSPVSENEPHAFVEARDAAQALAAALEPRIPSVTIKLTGVDPDKMKKVKVTVDGVPVPPVALNAPRAVDPGHHIIIGKSGPGGDPRQAEIDVAEKEAKDVTLDLPPDLTPEAPPSANPENPGAPPPPPPNPTLRILAWSGFGLGGAGLILGAVTGGLALSDLSTAKGQDCVNKGGTETCGPLAKPELSTASTMATLSTVGFIVGGVGVAGGITAFILSNRHPEQSLPPPAAAPPPPSPAATIHMYFGPTSGGVFGTF